MVLTPEGKRSDMYPSTLGALLEYDCRWSLSAFLWRTEAEGTADDIRALIRDFGLVEAETDETNLNQFLAHIGKRTFVNHVYDKGADCLATAGTRAKVAGQV